MQKIKNDHILFLQDITIKTLHEFLTPPLTPPPPPKVFFLNSNVILHENYEKMETDYLYQCMCCVHVSLALSKHLSFSVEGMGTSSILAGAVLAALLTAGGKTYDTKGLIHAVSLDCQWQNVAQRAY